VSRVVKKKGRVRYLGGKPRKPRKLKRDKNITPEEAKDRLSFSADSMFVRGEDGQFGGMKSQQPLPPKQECKVCNSKNVQLSQKDDVTTWLRIKCDTCGDLSDWDKDNLKEEFDDKGYPTCTECFPSFVVGVDTPNSYTPVDTWEEETTTTIGSCHECGYEAPYNHRQMRHSYLLGAESFSAEGGMDVFTQMIMLGFLDHSYAVAAIEQQDVSPSHLIPIYERMQEAWGGQDGMLDYLRLAQNNPAEGRLFAKTMMYDSGQVRDDKIKYLWSFDDEYSEADWRKEFEHTLNSASFKAETSQSLLSSIPLSLLAVGTGILASSLVYWNRQRE